jgi:hypothetical protein
MKMAHGNSMSSIESFAGKQLSYLSGLFFHTAQATLFEEKLADARSGPDSGCLKLQPTDIID